jgi:hypothetical protein
VDGYTVGEVARLYTSDARYTAPYDEIEPGLSYYVRDAIFANAGRGQGRGPAEGR